MNYTTLEAGAGRADVTPEVGTCLYGYAPGIVSTSVHDGLTVTALALRDGEETLLMLSGTVGDMDTDLTRSLREDASAVTGIPVERILFSATHTHSAPNVCGIEGWGGVDEKYVSEVFRPGVIKASREAFETLAPAEMSVTEVPSYVGVNRRAIQKDGSVEFGQNTWGCFDSTMTLLSFRRQDNGQGIFHLIHYGCHGTASGCNHEITRDWSGIMIDRMEAETGVMTAFWNGSMGDAGPRITNGQTTGNIHYTEELGGVAAQDAIRAVRQQGSYCPIRLKVHTGTVRLPYKELPTLEQVNQELTKFPDPEKLSNISALTYHHLCEIKAILESGQTEFPEALELETAVPEIGNAVFIPAPYELFADTSMRLRCYLGQEKHAMVLSNTNGYRGYLPSEDQLARGGYEVEMFLHAGLYLLKDNTDTAFINEILRLVQE